MPGAPNISLGEKKRKVIFDVVVNFHPFINSIFPKHSVFNWCLIDIGSNSLKTFILLFWMKNHPFQLRTF